MSEKTNTINQSSESDSLKEIKETKEIPAAATSTETLSSTSSVTKVSAASKPVLDTTTQKDIVVAKKAPTAQEIANSRQLSVVNELLASYKSYLSIKIATPKTFHSAAVAFNSAFSRVLDNPTPDSLAAMWTFFVDNKNGILKERTALSGVETLPMTARGRLELAYVLFRKAVAGVDVSNSSLVNQNALKTILKSPKTVAYLSAQSKTVKKTT